MKIINLNLIGQRFTRKDWKRSPTLHYLGPPRPRESEGSSAGDGGRGQGGAGRPGPDRRGAAGVAFGAALL